MRKLYPRLALQNIRRGWQFYLPYLLTVMASAAGFYMVLALNRPGLWPDKTRYFYLSAFMTIGTLVIGLFAVIFLTYTGRFLAKRRQRELGLYNVLGMGKGHIALTLGFETLYLALAGIGGGIAAGMVLQGLATALLCAVMAMPPTFSFSPSPAAAMSTAFFFCAILFFNLLLDLTRVKLQKPAELLRETAVGEKEPRCRWLLAVVGLLALGGGYLIALTARSAMDALAFYFIAVILVIVGTYCLFTAISIVVLKLLKANKRFYYQTTHFIGLSGMLYRMKRNAVGLANICILCTMVLVMVSGTLALYLGTNQLIPRRFPAQVTLTARYDAAAQDPLDPAGLDTRFTQVAGQWDYTPQKQGEAVYASITLVDEGAGLFREYDAPIAGLTHAHFTFLPYETYEAQTGQSVPHDGKAHIYSDSPYPHETLTLDFGQGAVVEYPVGQPLTALPRTVSALLYVGTNDHYVALPQEALIPLTQTRAQGQGDHLTFTREVYWDLGGDPSLHAQHIPGMLEQDWTGLGQFSSLNLESRTSFAQDYYALNGGFFFLGVFLGLLFLGASVLIIYYKQLMEGYEDAGRYHIMRSVGMDDRTIRRSINSQMRLVFFAPLLVAGIHVAFDFPLVYQLLTLFAIRQGWMEIACTAGVFALFALLYAGVYRLTARAYYKIVG